MCTVTILQKVRIEVKMLFIKCCLKLQLKAMLIYVRTYISMLSPSTLV